jgi:hypothetical protein
VIRFADRGGSPSDVDRGGDGEAVLDEHASPGLQSIIESLDPEVSIRVFDLGPAVSANISFLSRYSGHIQIADAVADLTAIVPDEDEPDRTATRVEEVVPVDAGDYDLVLLWDVLSYLDRDVAKTLVARLRSACRPGGRLLLLVHSGSEMPEQPCTYVIRSGDRIANRSSSTSTMAVRELAPAEVERLLEGFRIEASFVLRHGMREFVAVRM